MPLVGISVVTTCYNECDNVQPLIHAIRAALRGVPHEVIIVDDSSTDGTYRVASLLADVAVSKRREGQTKGLIAGIKLAKFDRIITIDADLENDPKWIRQLSDKLRDFDIVVASRPHLPRISEKIFSRVYRKRLHVSDILSNYRAYRRSIVPVLAPKGGETFGAEFLIRAHRNGCRIAEITVDALPRRAHARIGNAITANLRILIALLRTIRM